jgi:hypothetical protein
MKWQATEIACLVLLAVVAQALLVLFYLAYFTYPTGHG